MRGDRRRGGGLEEELGVGEGLIQTDKNSLSTQYHYHITSRVIILLRARIPVRN